jgi:Ca2+-binding RTX toxin-like protein
VIGALVASGVLLMSLLSAPAGGAVPQCNDLNATIVGTQGNDILKGTPERDVIEAAAGNDIIKARGGNDVICGSSGQDTIVGGPGNDDIWGGTGTDKINGEDGQDLVNAGPDTDFIFDGDQAQDDIDGNDGYDTGIPCEDGSPNFLNSVPDGRTADWFFNTNIVARYRRQEQPCEGTQVPPIAPGSGPAIEEEGNF